MSRSAQLSLAMIAAAALVRLGFLVFTGGGDDPEPEATPTNSNAEPLVR